MVILNTLSRFVNDLRNLSYSQTKSGDRGDPHMCGTEVGNTLYITWEYT